MSTVKRKKAKIVHIPQEETIPLIRISRDASGSQQLEYSKVVPTRPVISPQTRPPHHAEELRNDVSAEEESEIRRRYKSSVRLSPLKCC